MLDNLKVFQMYMAIRLHYTTNYDLFSNNGHVKNITYENLNKIGGRKAMINRVCKKFNTYREVADYFVAQYLHGDGSPFDEMIAEENYTKLTKFKIAPTYSIVNELSEYDIESLTKEPLPMILKKVAGDAVSIESAIALHIINPYVKETDYLGFNRLATIIKKSTRWIKFDKDLVKKELSIV
jgi:hypothetical protein